MQDAVLPSENVTSRSSSQTIIAWDDRPTTKIIREITCFTCSCIKGMRTLEFGEDITEALRSCPTNAFVALSKAKRAKQASTFRRSSFGRNSFVRQYFGYYNYNIEPFPVYQRNIAPEGSGYESDSSDYSSCSGRVGSPETAKKIPTPPTRSSSTDVSIGVTQADTDECTRIECHEPSRQHNDPKDYRSVKQESSTTTHLNQGTDKIIVRESRTDIDIAVTAFPRKMKANPGKKPVRVHLLTGDSILLVFDAKATVKDVFDQVCTLHSIKESHFFGLSADIENEHRFMDPKQRLNKYAPKEWGKELKRRDSDLSVQPSSIFTVQFQVQYFVEHPKLIKDPKSRHHYYLQLKKNVLQSKVPSQEEEIFTLAATSLHLDMGTFDAAKHLGRYFDPNEYVPAWFAKKWGDGYLWSHLPTMHAELSTTSTFEAQADYISRASCIEDVPVHYYKLYKTKKETEASVILGIYHQGIRIHHVAKDGSHLLDFEFPWAKVGRLFFAARRFDIYPEDLPSSRKLTYYTGSQTRSKYLLRLLRETHSLYMSLTPYVQHMRKSDGRQGRRAYRESYISGQDLEKEKFASERLVGDLDDCGKSPASNNSKDGRDKLYKSYNSSTSHGSSHTSGIESDSKQRTEEEEDDNAFVDDFDPIEHDGPPNGGVIFITQEHLEAPQHKSLSVTDLTESSPNGSHDDLDKAVEPETSSESVKSEQTVRETIPLNQAPATPSIESLPQEPHTTSPTPSLAEQNNNSNSNNGEAFVLTTNTLPPKTAKLRVSKAELPAVPAIPMSNDSPRSEYTSSSLARPVSVTVKNSVSHDLISSEPVKISHQALSARNSSPEYLSGPKRTGSRTFYDDTDSVFVQTRSQSVDLDGNLQSEVVITSPEKHRSHGGRKHHRKRGSRSSGNMKRSGSIDSSLHSHHNSHQPLFKHERHTKKDHQRHHRHKSMQEGPISLGAGQDQQVAGPYFSSTLKAEKSVDDLCHVTEHGTLTRSSRQRDLPTSMTASSDRLEQADAVTHQRKMSDACHKTLAAQHRKLSDSRVQRQQDSSNAKAAKPKKHSGHSSAKPNGHVSSAGNTPHKHEVLLRTKHERAHGDRRRPVSYHLASGALPPSYAAHQQGNGSCYNDAALTSRPSVFMDSFKEVIV
uniref:Uncharacterized protein LOC100185320 n=1 Tax=Phallusia mammillata TaxID=59560 RepID=A0A6F9DIA4_9ASCI|nr:uncharacterized protein LOC100185320 [Phallusia mammillata]